MDLFDLDLIERPFSGYQEYTEYLFACVDRQLSTYIERLMRLFAADNGGFKNVLYPDIEVARDLCVKHLMDFQKEEDPPSDESAAEAGEELDDELSALFSDFAQSAPPTEQETADTSIDELLDYIDRRAALTQAPLPLYQLCKKLDFSHFTVFCFACAILSSTQTNYASVFQVVNQNGNLSAPSIESAARVFYGEDFTITGSYSQMSLALEQLQPVLSLQINSAMPFSTIVSPDKRVIDFLFGTQPMRLDQNYDRFFSCLTDQAELDPFLANGQILEALRIAYQDGTRIFSLFGDEGSGRKFTIRHFCKEQGLSCVSINCSKLFVYDFRFVEQALWAAARECILTGACVCLDNLSYREDEKDKFFGYMDLAFGKFTRQGLTVFTASKEKMPMKQMTDLDFAQLELPTPSFSERERVWQFYAKPYTLNADVDLSELATKFLFTPGKIKDALRQGRSLASMNKYLDIPRSILFQSCNNQMSHELTQKATRIAANFGWDDIVMNPDQRLALKNACDQLIFRKQVYEQWNYIKKYPYGRGLSVLLFGAPGTGKSMCAQVIAHEMNLELYRVDLSKVVDKYVGETEKSISMIFREAKKCNVVLFFDECDTLFAKRSDDGGSNQSSNNNKTALLLQEVEAYDGVSVLATNYKHNIDPAFFRRMKFIVEFQFPDADTREMLWRTTIPKTTPLAEDVDIRFLAERFEFVGGNIKNCILNAAFLAAADPEAEGEVHMKHYLQAIKYEFVKTGKVFTRADFEPYANLVL
jgi:ATP-dependent 26S proteasome regulatory subunit